MQSRPTGLYRRFVDALVPEKYQDHGREAMRCRVLITVLVGLITAEVILYLVIDSILAFGFEGRNLSHGMISFVLTASIASLFLFWLTKNRELVANVFGVCLWATLGYVAWHTGGTASIALPLFLLLPVFIGVTSGKGWGILWTALVIMTWVGALMATSRGFEFPLITLPKNHVEGQVICLAITCILISIAVFQYESTTSSLWEELEEDKQVLEHIARHDQLSGLPNRRFFAEQLEQKINRANRYKLDFALLFFDLNGFKAINDNYGHAVGDELLKQLATRLDNRFRATDFVARWGGDEFAIIVENVSSTGELARVKADLARLTKQPIVINNTSFIIESSLGIAIYPQDGVDSAQLVRAADHAMYDAKQAHEGVTSANAGFDPPLADPA